MLSQVGEAYQGMPGLTERIDYYDSYATEYVDIDFTAKISDLCKLRDHQLTTVPRTICQ